MDLKVIDSFDYEITNVNDILIYLWQNYGDPHVPPLPKHLEPQVEIPPLVEITTSTIVSNDAYIHTSMVSSDSLQ